MKKFILIIAAFVLSCFVELQAQNLTIIFLDSTTTGTTVLGPGPQTVIYDDGTDANHYGMGYDYHITIESTCDSVDSTGTPRNICFEILESMFNVGCQDTLYIYDGPNIYSPLLVKRNNCFSTSNAVRFYASASNTSRCLTLRFRSAIRDSGEFYDGFAVKASCEKPCEKVTAHIDSVYDRTDLNTGAIVGHGTLHLAPAGLDSIWVYEYYDRLDTIIIDTHWWDSISYTVFHDTVWVRDSIQTDSLIRVDTNGMVMVAELCAGQGVVFHGHGEYSHNTGWYNPTDETSIFQWSLGADSVFRLNATAVNCNTFQRADCYDVRLHIVDTNGCKTTDGAYVQARVAQNPVKTIFDLTSICNIDSLPVNVGYDGDNGTLTLRKINFSKFVSKTYPARTFIPDGPRCQPQLPLCFEAPVTFTEFGAGKKVESAADICSICINYEHSYMGDYRISIRCPTYDENVSQTAGEAVLKYGIPGSCGNCDPLAPEGWIAGGGNYAGFPVENNGYDGSPTCDSLANPFGMGLDYCWSRNKDYVLVTGDNADVPGLLESGSWYISTWPTEDLPCNFVDPIPSYFHVHAGDIPTETSMRTVPPSDHENRSNYYAPASDFSDLIGCPLDGEWKAVICDFFGIDNGWIFNWSLDICGSSTNGCDYQVGLDSVIWHPDTNYDTDFQYGVYKGLQINKLPNDPTSAYISSPDTAGDFKIILNIYDEFGCRWDTATHITTVYTPRPNLGNDTMLCDVSTIILDASDPHTDDTNTSYRFTWEPFGEHTPTIETTPNVGSDITYIVEARNDGKNVFCVARDTIHIAVNPNPIPNFDPGMYPLEGCEPLTVNFNNTSKNGYKYRWIFGDGTYSTQKSPTHAYAAGTYDLKYYVESDKGCQDSLIYPNLVTVHPNPEASFSWEPVFPTVLHPSISLINNTTMNAPLNMGSFSTTTQSKYFWEIEYSKDYPGSYQTLTDANPTYEWQASNGEDISGSYNVRLIARTDNYGPSGTLIQCGDTVENTIIIINDNLMFPSVVTANGDGINDQFVIQNLIEGGAYPINSLDIYDKWGSRIYHADNITQYDQFWDPAKTNTPAGTYFYRFLGKGYKGNIEHNGVIEVIR